MDKLNIEQKAGATLLDEPLKFGIQIGGKEKVLKIRSLKAGTIIAISKIASGLKAVGNKKEAIPAMLEVSENLRPLTRIIALAILNGRIKNRFAWILTWFLMYQLTPREIGKISAVVVSQMNVSDFFFTMQLIAGANILRSMTEAEEERPSGEPLQESQKPSDTL